MSKVPLTLIHGPEIGHYGFPKPHPWGRDRLQAFLSALARRGLNPPTLPPRRASDAELRRFHDPALIELVRRAHRDGIAYLDGGDTPVYEGVDDDSRCVVGASLVALESIMSGHSARAFVPIAGLHHARRNASAGFCVFNDCGVVIETLLAVYGLSKVAYVDIDVHHGDGVYYGFEDDPRVVFADVHEDGRYLYPGTGAVEEIGVAAAAGCKLNVPLEPGAGDVEFERAMQTIGAFLKAHAPQFIILQCGADSIQGDPLAHLNVSIEAHTRAATALARLALELGHGRILGLGGGGYNRDNLAQAWSGICDAWQRLPVSLNERGDNLLLN